MKQWSSYHLIYIMTTDESIHRDEVAMKQPMSYPRKSFNKQYIVVHHIPHHRFITIFLLFFSNYSFITLIINRLQSRT